MRNLRYALIVLFIIAMGWTRPASAGNIYIGYTLGPASSDNAILSSPFGRIYFVGYKTDDYLGFEVGRVYLIETINFISGSVVVASFDTEFFGTNLNATATADFGPVSVFARGGLIDWQIEFAGTEIASDTDLSYGFGFDYNFKNRWALRLEWQRYLDIATADYDVDHSRFGVKYTF